MSDTLNIRVKNLQTSVPRVLRVIHRQGHNVQKMNMAVSMDPAFMDMVIELDCNDVPEQLVKLLQKQVEVESADSGSHLTAMGI